MVQRNIDLSCPGMMELILFQMLSYSVVFLNPMKLGGGEENANIIEGLELWEIVVHKSL